jgi:hypothetical protein
MLELYQEETGRKRPCYGSGFELIKKIDGSTIPRCIVENSRALEEFTAVDDVVTQSLEPVVK